MWSQKVLFCVAIAVVVFAQAVNGQGRQYLLGVNAFDSSAAVFAVQNDPYVLHARGHQPTDKFPTAIAVHPNNKFVYVSSKVTDEIDVFELEASTGRLRQLSNYTVPAGRAPQDLVFSPLKHWLYAPLRGGGISVFGVDQETGVLSAVKGSPFPAQKRTRSVAVHPSGEFVFAVNAHSNSVSVYQVNTNTGVLTQIEKSPFDAGDVGVSSELNTKLDMPPESGGMPYYVAIHPSGLYLYVTNFRAASLSVFSIDQASGELAAIKGSPFASVINPYAIAVHPDGKYVYVSSYLSNTIGGYEINKVTGELTPITKLGFSNPGEKPIALQFNDDGNRLFIANYHTNNITVFDVGERGKLSHSSTIQTRSGVRDIALSGKISRQDNERTFVLLGSGSANVKVLEKTGNNNFQAMPSIKLPAAPSALAFHPYRPIVYIASSTTGGIQAFRFSSDTNKFEPVEGDPTNPNNAKRIFRNIAIDKNGWYLYGLSDGCDCMSVFAIAPERYALSELRGSPLSTPAGPKALELDNAVRYAYVTNEQHQSFSVYRYLSAASPLVDDLARAGTPFKLTATPLAVQIMPSGQYLYISHQTAPYLSGYQIHHQSGLVREIALSTIAPDAAPIKMLAHPALPVLYALSENPKRLVVYSIKQSDGQLALIQDIDVSKRNIVALQVVATDGLLMAIDQLNNELVVFQVAEKNGHLNELMSLNIDTDSSLIAAGKFDL